MFIQVYNICSFIFVWLFCRFSFLLVATKSVQIVQFALGRSNDNLLMHLYSFEFLLVALFHFHIAAVPKQKYTSKISWYFYWIKMKTFHLLYFLIFVVSEQRRLAPYLPDFPRNSWTCWMNQGPLSDVKLSGRPCLKNISLRISMTLAVTVDFMTTL
jgi:hypothetical protein